MKILTYILISAAIILSVYNATKLDFDNLFEGESSIAVISILAAGCVIVLLVILQVSRKIAKKKSK
jgi:uncharacterized membrane protein